MGHIDALECQVTEHRASSDGRSRGVGDRNLLGFVTRGLVE